MTRNAALNGAAWVTTLVIANATKIGEMLQKDLAYVVKWSRLSEQIFRVDKWNLCRG
jgi:hypothetical protein